MARQPRDSETAQARRPAQPGRLTVSSVLHEPAQGLQVGTRPQVQVGKRRHAEATSSFEIIIKLLNIFVKSLT